jgi:hypothetical protein
VDDDPVVVVAAASAGLMTPCVNNNAIKDKMIHRQITKAAGAHQGGEEKSSRSLAVVTSVRKAKDIVGWDDVLCRPIYAASSSSSSSSTRTSSSSSPWMQATSGSSSDDDDDDDDEDVADNHFSHGNNKRKTADSAAASGTLAAMVAAASSTSMDHPPGGGRVRHGRHQRTFGIRRKRTLAEIELLEKLHDHDKDNDGSSREMALAQANNNSNMHDQSGVVEPVRSSSDDTKSSKRAPRIYRRRQKKAKTTARVSFSTNTINNENHPGDSNNNPQSMEDSSASNHLDVFDFPPDDDDGDDDNEQHKTPAATGGHKTSQKILQQPSARTSLGTARAFFDHLDRHCPIVLQAADDETNNTANSAKNVSIAPGGGPGQIKNANGRTRRLVSLRDASVAKAYQAYRQACRDTGVPPLSLAEFWKQRRMAIGRGGKQQEDDGDGGGAAEALYDGFLDEVME